MSYDFDAICAPSYRRLDENALNDDDGADSFFDVPESERTLGDEDFKTPRKTLPTHTRQSDIESGDLDNTLVETKTPKSERRSTRKSTRRVRISADVERIEPTSSSILSPLVMDSEEKENRQLRKSAGRTPKRLLKVKDAPETDLGDEDFRTPRKSPSTHTRESDIDATEFEDTLVETKTPKSTGRSARKSTRRIRISDKVERIESSPPTTAYSPLRDSCRDNEDPEIRKSAGRTPKKAPNVTVVEEENEEEMMEEDTQEEETKESRRMSVITEEEEEEEAPAFKTPAKTPRKSIKQVCFDGIFIQPTPEKTHHMVTRQDVRLKTPTLELRGRRVSKRTLEPDLAPSRGLTLAEQIYHFQNDTPERFHVWRHVEPDHEAPQIKITVPYSPALMTKARARPTLVPSREEREEQEMEELRKQQVKAQPVSDKVLHPQPPPKPAPRPSTVPQPFHLTEVGKKKITAEDNKPFQFKARPVPTKVYHLKKETPREKMDKVIKKKREQLDAYERSLEMLKKKEEKIAQLREEQGKVKPFQATPLPKFLGRSRDSILSSCSSLNSSHHQHCLDTKDSPEKKRFRASRPSVLYRKPFEPQRTEKTFTEVTNFVLNTEKRAMLREEYNKKVRENKELTQKEKEELNEIERQIEAENLARYRADLVHRPVPVPLYPDASVSLNRTSMARISRL